MAASFIESTLRTLRRAVSSQAPTVRKIRHEFSPSLGREVALDVYLPPDFRSNKRATYPLLILNDGQDLPRMSFSKILSRVWKSGSMPYFVAVGVHAGDDRMKIYGTARQADYKGRGGRAANYKSFIVNELIPLCLEKYRIDGRVENTAIAGFSLGGLSAMDIGWATPEIFGSVGVFSGALWWRWEDVNPKDPDGGRIMHDILLNSGKNDGQRFWFEVGTLDEEDDRNNNGIIDAIDDTVDLIGILRAKGYSEADTRYLEIPDGTHDPMTWGEAMPDFLYWAFGE